MAQKTGIATQIGYVSEVTPGVPVTVTTFLPLVSSGLDKSVTYMESAAVVATREVLQSENWALGPIKCGGPVGLELYNKNLRYLFKNMFGSESGSGPYTYTPGNLSGLALTIQEGIPDQTGTVQPWTFTGCKILDWELAVDEGKIATLGLNVEAMNAFNYRLVADGVTNSDASLVSATAAFGPDDVGSPVSGSGITAGTTILSVTSATTVVLSAVTTATATSVSVTIGVALASASYNSGLKPLHYDQASLTLAGSAFKVKAVRIKGNNAPDERRFLGQRTTDEPLGTKLKEYTGLLSAEFNSMTAYKRFVNGTEAALVVTVTNGTESVAITMNVVSQGSKPKAPGRGLVMQDIPFKCVASAVGADSTAISAVVSTA